MTMVNKFSSCFTVGFNTQGFDRVVELVQAALDVMLEGVDSLE